MHVEKPIYQNQLFDKLFKSCLDTGMQPNPDFNDWSHGQEGFGEYQARALQLLRFAVIHLHSWCAAFHSLL